MTTPAVTPVNSMNKVATANPAPQDNIWSQEINPPVPAGHADSTHNGNDTFNHSENPDAVANQDPAAINISPEVKQAAKESFLKGKEVIIAGGAAIMAALVAFRNKKLPMMKNTINDAFKEMGKLIPVVGGYVKKYTKVVNTDELSEYVKELTTKGPQHFREINIHSSNISDMTAELKNIKTVAESYLDHNKKKKPVITILMNPEHSDMAKTLLNDFNTKALLKLEKNGADITKDAIQSVKLTLEPHNLATKYGGPNVVGLKVSAARGFDDTNTSLTSLVKYNLRRLLNGTPVPD